MDEGIPFGGALLQCPAPFRGSSRTFELDNFPANGSDTGLVHRRYLLRAKSPNSSDDTSGEIIAIGFADLSLRKDSNGRWAIFRWVDHVDPAVTATPAAGEQRCWSYRRLQSLAR